MTAPIVAILAATLVISAVQPAMGEPLAPTDAPTESLTVRECIARARLQSPDPRVASAEMDAATLDSTASSRLRRAALSVEGGATVAPEHFYDPVLTNLGEYELKLRLQAPLFDGGDRRRDRQRSALFAGESRATLEQAARDAGLRAGALAIEWLRLAASEQSQLAAIAWLERLAGTMVAGVRSGMRGRADALRATLERDAAVAELEMTRRDKASVARDLGRELGLSDAFAPAVREENDVELSSPDAADSVRLANALRAAPEVRLAQLGSAERQLDLDAARRRSGWRVDFSADAGLAGSDLTHAIPPDVRLAYPNATVWDRLHRDLGASVSLQFHRPLLDRSMSATVLARDASARAQDLRWRTAEERQDRLVVELLARWRSAATRYALTREVATRAEEHLLRLESLHAAGEATLLELLDARRAHDDANQRIIDARAETLAARLDAETRQ